MDCPSTVYVELGKNGIINCKILNNGDVYWYKGNSTKTSPIVRLENGEKKISQENNRYDIDEEGSLVIKKIEEQNYGLYSVVNFYASDKHDTDQIKVEIAVKPQTMCPIIAGCNDCNHCLLTESKTGNISCSIRGTRPQVHLNIVTENWINVIRNISEETYDPVTDTWNTAATIQLSEWYDCRSPLHLRCVTENTHPFELSDSVAHVISDSCRTTTQISGDQTPLAEDTKRIYAFAIAITIGVIFVVIGLVLSIVLCRKSETSRKRKPSKRDMEKQEQSLKLLQKANIPADFQPLMDALKNTYSDFEGFTCTPNGELISIDYVFQEINFTLTKADNSPETISSSQMMEKLFGKERSFVFIDDGEYGRKAFMQCVCAGLSAENLDENIILYVNLKGLDRNVTIADAIGTQMNLDGKLSPDVIRNILSTQKCLFVFHEVHELNQSHEGESSLRSEDQQPGEMTINDVLTASHRFEGYRKARRLFISNNKINVISFTERHTYIRIAPFSDENVKLYVRRIFKCYQNLNATNSSKSSKKTEEAVDDENQDVSSVIAHTDGEEVTNLILDKENIIRQMNMCPSSLILLIHLLISDISKKVINNITFYINRRSYLTRLILDCLRFQYFPNQAKCKNVDHLMLELGQSSFEDSLEDNSFTETCNFISKCTRSALETKTSKDVFATAFTMGLLKLVTKRDCVKAVTDNASYPSLDDLVQFRHNYIQEYFAAQAITSNKAVYERFLNSKGLKEDERMKRVLQFMHSTERKKRQKLLERLVEKENWNNLIDCLFECENDEDYKMIKSALSPLSPLSGKYTVNIIDMDKPYHGMAVSRFCKNLANHNVSLEALTFRRPCEFQYFSKLEIPVVNLLVFFEIDFQQGNNFIAFVKKACEMKVKGKIQFVKCKCPEEITKEEMQEIADLIQNSSNAPKILRTESVIANTYEKFEIFSNVKWEKLNLESGCWETS